MPKRPTLQDVADEVGLATATVSYALRGERGSDETVRRVREAADRLGYQADPIAQALASGRSRTVAVLCGSTRDLWQQSLAADLARALMARGRHAILADADGDGDREAELLAKLRDQRPDGLLVAPLDPFASRWENLAQQLPLVSIGDRLLHAPSAGAVVFDNAKGFAEVFDHLAGLGHRHIAVVLPQRPSTPDRPAADLVAHEAARCKITATLVHTPPATADPASTVNHLREALLGLGFESLRDGAGAPLQDTAGPTGPSSTSGQDDASRGATEGPDGRPTAAFCLSDSFAFAMLRAARRLGLRVPEDLSVVGFEDLEFADLAGPGLTSVDWGQEAVVEAAVSQLLAAVDDDAALETRVIAPRLVIRGSSGPPSRG